MLVYLSKEHESFDGNHSEEDINMHPDKSLRSMLNNIKQSRNNRESKLSKDYVKRRDIERSALTAAREFCPVSPDFDLSQYIKKSEIKPQICPKVPDLKDYVLKSSIPPVQKCPSCICPKVKVEGGLCKKCPNQI